MMIEAVKELSIVKEHLIKLQIIINAMHNGGSLNDEVYTEMSANLNDMRTAHNQIDVLLADLIFNI